MAIHSAKKHRKLKKTKKVVVENIIAAIAAGLPPSGITASVRSSIDKRSATVKYIDELCGKKVAEYLDYISIMHADPAGRKLLLMDDEFMAEIAKLDVDATKYENYFILKTRETITFINSLKKNT